MTTSAALTEGQRTEAALQFLLLDQDSDDCISADELGAFLRATGLYPTPSEITSYLPIVDASHRGLVTQADALALVEKLYPQRTQQEELRAALNVLDDDADGYMTTAQLRHVLTTMGTRMTPKEAEEVLKDVEKDAEGMVNVEDLIQMLMPPVEDDHFFA